MIELDVLDHRLRGLFFLPRQRHLHIRWQGAYI